MYVGRLSDEERTIREKVVKNLEGSSRKARRARILLKAGADGPGWTDATIAEAFDSRVQTIENLCKRLVTEGFDLALDGKKRLLPPTPPKLDGEGEAMRSGKPTSDAALSLATATEEMWHNLRRRSPVFRRLRNRRAHARHGRSLRAIAGFATSRLPWRPPWMDLT